ASSMRSQTNKINSVLLCVVKYLAIRLAFTHAVLNLAPEMRLLRHSLLQSTRCFMIGSFPAKRVPGNFGFIQGKRRQDVQQMQFRLVLLREGQRIVERQL